MLEKNIKIQQAHRVQVNGGNMKIAIDEACYVVVVKFIE